MRNSFYKVRTFQSPYGVKFPLIPRRLGMHLKETNWLGVRRYPENWYRNPNRLFEGRWGANYA